MRFGTTSTLAFVVEPIDPSWPRVAVNERGPWARLEIWIGGENACISSVPGSSSLREAVNVPLAPMVDWIVKSLPAIAFEESARAYPTDTRLHRSLRSWKNALPASGYDEESWDDERYGWWQRHFLEANGDGAWLPNLAWVRSDGDLWVSSYPSRFATPQAPRFYLDDLHQRIRWEDARSALEELVDWTAQELRALGLSSAYPWSLVDSPVARALEIDLEDFVSLGLGLGSENLETLFGTSDLVAIRDALALDAEDRPDQSVSLQALRDLEIEPGLGVVLAEVARRVSVGSSRLEHTRARFQGVARTATAVEQGKDAARALRRSLGLEGEPLDRLDSHVRNLGVAVDHVEQLSRRNRSISGHDPRGSSRIALLRDERPTRPWAERMELARALGHLVTDGRPGDIVGAGSSNHASGPRRRRSGAFAAELLLPRTAILERTEGVLDRAAEPEIFEELMAEFGVGARTAAWQCYNSDCFSSEEVRDEVISRYANDDVPLRAA